MAIKWLQSKQLLMLPKLFLILTVVFLMWIVIVLSGPLFGVFEPGWTGVSPSLWLIIISVLIGAFIVIDIILYATPWFSSVTMQKTENIAEPVSFSDVERRDGMDVHEFTYPVGTKGGVFSKTYVQIDKDHLVRIRNQILTKDEVWKE